MFILINNWDLQHWFHYWFHIKYFTIIDVPVALALIAWLPQMFVLHYLDAPSQWYTTPTVVKLLPCYDEITENLSKCNGKILIKQDMRYTISTQSSIKMKTAF